MQCNPIITTFTIEQLLLLFLYSYDRQQQVGQGHGRQTGQSTWFKLVHRLISNYFGRLAHPWHLCWHAMIIAKIVYLHFPQGFVRISLGNIKFLCKSWKWMVYVYFIWKPKFLEPFLRFDILHCSSGNFCQFSSAPKNLFVALLLLTACITCSQICILFLFC